MQVWCQLSIKLMVFCENVSVLLLCQKIKKVENCCTNASVFKSMSENWNNAPIQLTQLLVAHPRRWPCLLGVLQTQHYVHSPLFLFPLPPSDCYQKNKSVLLTNRAAMYVTLGPEWVLFMISASLQSNKGRQVQTVKASTFHSPLSTGWCLPSNLIDINNPIKRISRTTLKITSGFNGHYRCFPQKF